MINTSQIPQGSGTPPPNTSTSHRLSLNVNVAPSALSLPDEFGYHWIATDNGPAYVRYTPIEPSLSLVDPSQDVTPIIVDPIQEQTQDTTTSLS